MLAIRQKKRLLEEALKSILVEGVYPEPGVVIERLRKMYPDMRWGLPLARLRPAIEGQPIGGPDGTDIYRTFEEIREDIRTLYTELIDTADAVVTELGRFQTAKDGLVRRAQSLIQAAKFTTDMLSQGGLVVFYDTFNSADMIDMQTTTAQIDLVEGCITLPVPTNTICPMDLSGTTVVSERYPNAEPHGNILDALTDFYNTGWYASLGGGKYTCTLLFPPKAQGKLVNTIRICPMSRMWIRVELSNDGHNFYEIVNTSIDRESSWSFRPTSPVMLRLEVTGDVVGIRRLGVLYTGFIRSAVFESTIHTANDVFGSPARIGSIRLDVEDDVPKGTRIDYYVMPYDAAGSPMLSQWIRLDGRTVNITTGRTESLVLVRGFSSGTFLPESPDTDGRPFYVANIARDVVSETGVLLRGVDPAGANRGQFRIDYIDHDWSQVGDKYHLPSLADWEAFAGAESDGYIRPLSRITQVPADVLQSSDEILYDFANPFSEVSSPRAADGEMDWLVFGIAGRSGKLLADNGNYRLTSYIYFPEASVFYDIPCLVYNPASNGGLGKAMIAPFAVYINGELVASSKHSWAGELSSDLSATSYVFAFDKGWNKLEILLYYTGVAPGTQGSSTLGGDVATSGIGLYIGFNPYLLADRDPNVVVRAQDEPMRRVSEFALRHLVSPGDTNCWAWTDTAPYKGILLNHNPYKSGSIDGHITVESPTMLVSYEVNEIGVPSGVKLRASLSMTEEAERPPRIYGYKITANPTGGI